MRAMWLAALLVVLIFTAGCISQMVPKPKETAAPVPTATPAPMVAPEHKEMMPAVGIPSVNPFKGDAKAIAAGKAIYEVNCQPCHGANGKGTGLPNQPDFTNATWWAEEKDDHLFTAVSEGVAGTPMLAWKDILTPDERWQVLAYGHSLAK